MEREDLSNIFVHGTVAWANQGGFRNDGHFRSRIITECTPLSTTGGHVWNGAYRMFNYFEEQWEEVMLMSIKSRPAPLVCRPKLNVLELGAGCGWLGMALAIAQPVDVKRLCMTEQVFGGALDWLNHNLDLNKNDFALDSVDTMACDWTHYIELLNKKESGEGASPDMDTNLVETEWDLIIGSDLVYNSAGVKMLPKVMKALCAPHTHIFYAHTKFRYEMCDIEFLEELKQNGFKVEELREPGISTPPESPPVLSECFPPMRIAVYHITPL